MFSQNNEISIPAVTDVQNYGTNLRATNVALGYARNCSPSCTFQETFPPQFLRTTSSLPVIRASQRNVPHADCSTVRAHSRQQTAYQ